MESERGLLNDTLSKIEKNHFFEIIVKNTWADAIIKKISTHLIPNHALTVPCPPPPNMSTNISIMVTCLVV